MTTHTDKVFVGIDPGAKGAVAEIHPDGSRVLFDMLKPEEFINWTPHILSDCVVGVELVHPLPGQSCIASFTYGENNLLAKLIGMRYNKNIIMVSPQRWKNYYGLKRSKEETKTAFKRRSVDKALELFPNLRGFLRYSQDGRAEALLIANYLKETYEDDRS